MYFRKENEKVQSTVTTAKKIQEKKIRDINKCMRENKWSSISSTIFL